MFEIILLIVVTGGIASFARARGGKPWLWGTLTVAGYFLVPLLVVFFAAMCLNQRYAVICEASKRPYASKALPFS